MNVLLWILQVLLGLYYMLGGKWLITELPADMLRVLPRTAWLALGVLQVLFGLGLILPGLLKKWPKATPVCAAAAAVETVAAAAAVTGFPGLWWAVIPGLLALFVAYGRAKLRPFQARG